MGLIEKVRPRTLGFSVQRRYTREELVRVNQDLSRYSGIVKQWCGVTHNCAYMMMTNAMEGLRKHPAYRQKFSKVRGAFDKALKMYYEWWGMLLTAKEPRYFHLADLSEEVRKRYDANAKDEDYLEYWKGIGFEAYVRIKDQRNVLRHKYLLSLTKHGQVMPEVGAEVLLVNTALSVCISTFETCIKEILADGRGYSEESMRYMFRQFDIRHIADQWLKATKLLLREYMDIELDDFDARNQQMATQQFVDTLCGDKMVFGAIMEATEAYEDIFRTKGTCKKVQRMIADVAANVG